VACRLKDSSTLLYGHIHRPNVATVNSKACARRSDPEAAMLEQSNGDDDDDV